MASFKNVFCQFLSTVNQHIANVELRLKSGAIDEQISKFQDFVGKKLPKDFVELYRLHDGDDGEGATTYGRVKVSDFRGCARSLRGVYGIGQRIQPS